MDKDERFELPIVEVDGKQVFTTKYILEQMLAQSCRIDRANMISWVAICMSVIAIILAIALL